MLVGHIPFIDGVPGPLFDDSGPAGEATAFFTVRLDPGGPPPLMLSPGSNVNVVYTPPGQAFNLYFDETPDQDWANRESVSDGIVIATLEATGFL